MNTENSADTASLTELALGTLSMDGRRELARRALCDPALARELKFALRLADESAALTRDWVRVAAKSAVSEPGWRRPLAGMVASLAIAAAVMLVPWHGVAPPSAPTVAVSDMRGVLPDSLSAGSFEASGDNIGSGSFE